MQSTFSSSGVSTDYTVSRRSFYLVNLADFLGSNALDLKYGRRQFFSQIMTATVETVAEQLDLAPVVAAERILPAVARQVTISDADVGMWCMSPHP